MTAHGTRMFQALDGVEEMIVDFLKAGVGPVATAPVVSAQGSGVYFESVEAMTPLKASGERVMLRWFSSASEAEDRGLRRGRGE